MGADVIHMSDDVYPTSALEGLASAFVGFAGGFSGRQDSAHIHQAGLQAVCVDRDPDRLMGMRDLYPDNWEFVTADVYQYATMRYAQGARFDVVSLDPYTSQFQECANYIDLWCRLAMSVIVIGVGKTTDLATPDGWCQDSFLKRSRYQGGTYWAVLLKL